MNRKTVLLTGLLVAGTLAFPSIAAPPIFGPTDRVADDLHVQPADTANGDYAVLNEKDEIELLLSGANPNVDGGGVSDGTLTPLDRVFTITYTGDQYAEVWITDDNPDLRFFRGDDPDRSIESPENSVHLRPEQTVSVGVLIDTRGDHDVESADTFNVHAELAMPASDSNDRDGARDESPTPTETPPSAGADTPDSDPVPGIALDDATSTQAAPTTESSLQNGTTDTAAPTGTAAASPTETVAPGTTRTAQPNETGTALPTETGTALPTETGTAQPTETDLPPANGDSVNGSSADRASPIASEESAHGGPAEPPEDAGPVPWWLLLVGGLLLAGLGLGVIRRDRS